ncbi:MAG TPA: XRE family transcriptional regulator [Elusimicrobiales bacterium]|nr:XRE family transcriptional regulator [Elusimicrobiales bacterium]
MTLGEKIKALLKHHGMTKKALAKKLKFKDSSVISHWTNGRFYPSIGSKKKLSDVFNKPIEYFENDEQNQVIYSHANEHKSLSIREKPEIFPNIMHVGVIGTVVSENFAIDFERTPSGYLPIFMEVYADKRIFALRVDSECMIPTAKKDDYVIIEQTNYVESGELAMVEIDKGYTLKKVIYSKDIVLLKPDNPSLKTIRLKPDTVKIVGRVKGVFRKP